MRSQVPHIPAMRLRTIAAWCVSLTLMPILSVTAAPVGAPTPAQYTQALGMSDHYASLVDRQPTAPVMGRCRTFSVSTWGGAQSPGAGRRSVSRPGRLGTAGDTLEMPIQTVVRLGQQQGVFPQGLRSFADSIGRDGARLAAFDFVSQKALLDISKDRAAAKCYVPLKALAARGRYASSPERPLNIYGTHVIPLTPQTGAKAISVSLQERPWLIRLRGASPWSAWMRSDVSAHAPTHGNHAVFRMHCRQMRQDVARAHRHIVTS